MKNLSINQLLDIVHSDTSYIQAGDEIISRLQMVDKLKCCGNCRNHYRPDLAEPCKTRFDFGYCDNWTSDGRKRSERK
jgi:hypothetical protein